MYRKLLHNSMCLNLLFVRGLKVKRVLVLLSVRGGLAALRCHLLDTLGNTT